MKQMIGSSIVVTEEVTADDVCGSVTHRVGTVGIVIDENGHELLVAFPGVALATTMILGDDCRAFAQA